MPIYQNYRERAYDLFDEWVNEHNYSKRMINFLVEQLTSDTYWLKENISKVDRDLLIELGKLLETKGD